ncbi:hypothetical protein ACFWIW_11015 [Amycolatopsis sp. NPDC058340]|uniref:hypothetical protein n=1 Tax=Amycolatopsis sp. NPDC058340 TaxID=3346453 RepID=UPI003665F635
MHLVWSGQHPPGRHAPTCKTLGYPGAVETRRKEVGQEIKRARRRKKFKSQKAFAEHIDVHESSVAYAEIGSDRIGESVFEAIEGGIDWPIGSTQAYIDGTGAPPWTLTPTPAKPPIEPRTEMPAPHEWSAEARRKILAMSVEDILEFARQIRITSGDRAAILWLKEASRIKAEAPTIEAEISSSRDD